MYDFDFQRPDTLAGALKLLKEEDAQALAGGQTLVPTLKARLAMPSILVSIAAIAELKGVCVADDGAICIGAGTTHADIAAQTEQSFPALSSLAIRIGDPAVRNRGTIGGSLANNDPSACYPAATLACGATLRTDRRDIPADAYFQGMFTTALDEGEILTEVRFPVPEAASYQKFEQPASRFALVGVFAARYSEGARVAVTGASEGGVFRWTEAETALSETWSPEAIAGLSLPADGMIGDIHGTPDYRAHLVGVMTRRAVAAA